MRKLAKFLCFQHTNTVIISSSPHESETAYSWTHFKYHRYYIFYCCNSLYGVHPKPVHVSRKSHDCFHWNVLKYLLPPIHFQISQHANLHVSSEISVLNVGAISHVNVTGKKIAPTRLLQKRKNGSDTSIRQLTCERSQIRMTWKNNVNTCLVVAGIVWWMSSTWKASFPWGILCDVLSRLIKPNLVPLTCLYHPPLVGQRNGPKCRSGTFY